LLFEEENSKSTSLVLLTVLRK